MISDPCLRLDLVTFSARRADPFSSRRLGPSFGAPAPVPVCLSCAAMMLMLAGARQRLDLGYRHTGDHLSPARLIRPHRRARLAPSPIAVTDYLPALVGAGSAVSSR